ncbi:MAG: 2-amino-4-hydroxy-6-hydroxymethyldihydropteridine diphosphokinase [Candidatus Lindowbacteria bacterium RIFCSPLOWO2_12_FULL_62_27]|nr:MAG: 2-amino-4-hydroxy-6-hydroxymethyldihydropteridine diphosphokinase [Candidatus Lindowbacteria bacterium RIFCSPLOWO2_12_FULL_62_27]OGH63977.1 MAG: 2-amino-4-hydroxy-6-hydroxymethyldihydropteridine diphosphokinase [Candidatus Lindowbacteria bacterium RIFCSPLOWO2_02_FULL_62_12]
MRTYHLSLGSNMGDRASILRSGLDRLKAVGQVRKVSAFYETKPWGNPDQADFLNAAAEFQTDLLPEGLLDTIKKIEMEAGRDLTAERWGPRPLDIDILLQGTLRLSTPRLTIPHPHLADRDFVLAPLSEIAPEVEVPGTGKTAAELWAGRQASGR